MITVILTAYKEPSTIGKAIEAFLRQISKKDEILVACPDEETKKVILGYSKKHKQVKYIKDPGQGKPVALNIIFKKAKGDFWILSDGDVFVNKRAVKELLKPFKDPKIGAVSGRPISTNPRNTMLGYWSHLLSDIGAHETRMNLIKEGKFLVCSGYLYAIRKGIIKKCPEDALSDDAVISHLIWSKGYKIGYAPDAKVYIKYPTTFEDWLKQKKRSTGGYLQIKDYVRKAFLSEHPKNPKSFFDVKNIPTMRSFGKEAMGFFKIWSYPKNLKEFIWTKFLVLARIYMWALIFINQKIRKRTFKQIWVRVESTK